MDQETRNSAAKRLGVQLEATGASSRYHQYSRAVFTGQLVVSSTAVKCKSAVKNTSWSELEGLDDHSNELRGEPQKMEADESKDRDAALR